MALSQILFPKSGVGFVLAPTAMFASKTALPPPLGGAKT
jgi:hypothetical protein